MEIIKLEKANNLLKNEINQLKQEKSKLNKNNISFENKYKDISDTLNIYIPYLNKLKEDNKDKYKYKSFNEISSIINNEI